MSEPLMDDLATDVDEPVDPNAHEFNDDIEGADDAGDGVRSVDGSELDEWEDD